MTIIQFAPLLHMGGCDTLIGLAVRRILVWTLQLDESLKGLSDMRRRKRPSQRTPSGPVRRRRRLILIVVGIVAFVLLLVFGREVLAALARRMAARQMDMWAISAAQQWLERAAWLDPGDGEVELMRAACYRRRNDPDRWHRAMLSAEQKGVPISRLQHEKQLAALGSGQLYSEAEALLSELLEAGVSPGDVGTALLRCYLAQRQYYKARVFLEAWRSEYVDDAHAAYLWGMYWLRLEEFELARTQFQVALERQPRHELAREVIAEQCENQNRLDLALEQYIESVTLFPESTIASVGLARVLRRLSRNGEARALLKPLTVQPEPPAIAILEMAQVELESGNYQEADRLFAEAELDGHDDMLLPAAIASTLTGDTTRAEQLIARYDAKVSAPQHATDLEARVSVNPLDTQAADQLSRLLSQSIGPGEKQGAAATAHAKKEQAASSLMSAAELYSLHCAACHGANGDGNGRAARQLYPRPRDLRTGRSRLVGTLNGIPRLAELESVLKQGMPGTSMQPFEDLSEDQLRLLAQEVQRINREGVRERFIDTLKDEGEEIDEDEVREVVELCTTSGEIVPVPQIGPADAQIIAKGKNLYSELGCEKCHGDDGIGAVDMDLFDDKGRPSRARDLVHEPFKGGQEPDSIYLRIRLGMPGSAHPGCPNVSDEELTALVHYCVSLAREPKSALTNHQRTMLATGRAYLSALGKSSTQ